MGRTNFRTIHDFGGEELDSAPACHEFLRWLVTCRHFHSPPACKNGEQKHHYWHIPKNTFNLCFDRPLKIRLIGAYAGMLVCRGRRSWIRGDASDFAQCAVLRNGAVGCACGGGRAVMPFSGAVCPRKKLRSVMSGRMTSGFPDLRPRVHGSLSRNPIEALANTAVVERVPHVYLSYVYKPRAVGAGGNTSDKCA